jgi:transglutaminase-like putative cysteine protease
VNPRLTLATGVATVLASLALYPLIYGPRWFWDGAGAVLVVCAIGALTRMRTVPVVLCLAAALAGLFLYLNLVFAGPQSWGGLIPTGSSLHHLGRLVSLAHDETSRYAPPVPNTRGILLMTSAGIGIIAVVVDLLAVRLRRPAIAGLPLLVLFCVPLTTDAKPGWVGGTFVFCLAMAGYLGLLSADSRDRLRLWGRLVHRWHDESDIHTPDTRPLTAAGRRIGSAAVVLAIFLPLLVPGLRQHRLFSGSGGTGGHGSHSQISLPDPVDLLSGQLRDGHRPVVLTYTTPDPEPPYIQVYVLGTLGAKAWTMSPPKTTDELRNGNLPAVPGLARGTRGTTVKENISLSPGLTSTGTNNLSYLPLPYAARNVKIDGNWRADPGALTVLSAGAKLAGLHYTVTSEDVDPAPQQLRDATDVPAALAGYLRVPPAFNSLRGLAHRIVGNRTTAYGDAVALQGWFTKPGNFKYSLNVAPARNPNALIDFLTKNKTGFCQQFAFAMAVLARLLDIPSRVVVGYTQGSVGLNGDWVVRTSDAHAWPELYFPGAGWLRFEPTPGGTTGQGSALPPAYSIPPSISGLTGDPAIQNFGNPSPAPTSTANPGGQIGKLNHEQLTGGAQASKKRGGVPVAPIAILVLVAAGLIAPRTVRTTSRRLRWLRATDDGRRAHAAWLEVRDDLADYRFECRASESPRALARRVAETLHLSTGDRQALTRVALAAERASYAVRPADSGSLGKDVATTRRAISRACDPPARLLAVVMPLSTLIPMRRALQNALDVFGWMDVITSKARGRPRRRRHPGPALP